MKKLRPLYDKVLIKRDDPGDVTTGGIFIPNTAQQKPLEGKIIAVGPGKLDSGIHQPLSVKIGDRVMFSKYAETEIVLDGEKFILLKEDDILGIIS